VTTRPDKGRGLFYHRDSEAHSDLAPPQYVEWARTEAARLGVTFTGTPAAITDMIARTALDYPRSRAPASRSAPGPVLRSQTRAALLCRPGSMAIIASPFVASLPPVRATTHTRTHTACMDSFGHTRQRDNETHPAVVRSRGDGARR